MKKENKHVFIKARWNKGKMSQQELADIMGVSRQTIRNWEDKIHEPTAKDIIKLSKALGLTVNQIVNHYK